MKLCAKLLQIANSLDKILRKLFLKPELDNILRPPGLTPHKLSADTAHRAANFKRTFAKITQSFTITEKAPTRAFSYVVESAY